MSEVKRLIKRVLPGLVTAYSTWRLYLWKRRVQLRIPREIRHVIDPHRAVNLEVRQIQFACRWDEELYKPGMYDKQEDRGRIVDGNWDMRVIPFEELDIYRAFRDRFVGTMRWQDTDFYHRLLGQIRAGVQKRGMKTQEDLDRRMSALDELYEKIKREGYKPLSQVPGSVTATRLGSEDEVSVRIGRHGDLLFEDGRHRLSVAKVQGIATIPGRVTVRHKQWLDLVQDIWAYAEENDGRIDEPVSHPDLDHLPAIHGWDGWEMIERHLPFTGGSALVVGCHWGFYCHRLEALGFECVGVEVSARHFRIAQRLRRAENRRFELVRASVLECDKIGCFDLLLALEVFQNLLKSQELRDKLIDFLGRTKMRAMIIGWQVPCDRDDNGGCDTFDRDGFVRFFVENSNLPRVVYMGRDGGGRDLFLLTTI